MPGKLRKSRSRNNNNRTISKQSRKRKTPKANANVKSKSGKRSRRRVKRGGADGDNQCEGITLDSLTEKRMIYSMKDKFRSKIHHEFLNLIELRKLIQGCEKKYNKSIKDRLIALIKNRGYYDEQITKLLNYTEKNFEDYKNKTRNRFNYLMVGAIKMAMSDFTFSKHDKLLGWSLINKNSRLQDLLLKDLDPTVFIERGLKLLFTDEDEDITCDKATNHKGAKKRKIQNMGKTIAHINFYVRRGTKNVQYTALDDIYRVKDKTKMEKQIDEIHGNDGKFLSGNKLKLNDDERKKRKEQIKEILSALLKKLIFDDILPENVFSRELENTFRSKALEYQKKYIIDKINEYHRNLSVFTGKWFKDFCTDPNITFLSTIVTPSYGYYDTACITLRTYTSLVTDIYLEENDITIGE